jgi:hypothetical protein
MQLLRRLTRAIVERTFPLAPSEGSVGRNWDVLGNIQATQLMGSSKVLLVAAPGFERDFSRTILNSANRTRVPFVTVVGAFVVVPLACILVPFSRHGKDRIAFCRNRGLVRGYLGRSSS